MRKRPLMQLRAMGLLVCALAVVSAGRTAVAQDSSTTQLLSRAHTLEVRGRMDLASQNWQQVLLVDPNNTEALAGMARAEKSAGHIDEANQYLAKLRAVNPSDPNIAKVENMGTAQDPSVLLKQAGQLSQQGQYGRAMAILKQVYGNDPPEGEAALSYYETEAATEDTRPQAVAGLRALADKHPEDPRYAIALGKILTYNPRTRAEGRKLLAKYPNDTEASEALRQALVWDQQNPATAGEIRAYVNKHPDQQLSGVLTDDEKLRASQQRRTVAPMSAEEKAALAEKAAQGREVQEAYAALNAKRYSEAEQRFQVMLAKNPSDPKALAGLGYIRMQQANFGGAISYLSQAVENGDHTSGLAKALQDARFYYTMREATGALNEDDLNTAIADFQTALAMRPTDDTALQGLGGTLLKAEQPEPAISVYTTYVKLHSNELNAWKGLFLSYAAANRFDLALGVDRKIPASIKAQLTRDPDYLRTLASVYAATNRDAEAQRILQMALQLPFPADARGLRADVQMQYAALLEAAGHHAQAAGLYREVLAADSTNTNAWVGLIQTEHSFGNDADVYVQLQQMPPASYQAAMQEPGFATTVATVYSGQGHDDLAQSVLEEFLNNQQANNQKPFVAAQVTLANLYLKHGDTAKAFPLFENILTNNPDRPDAWKGLLNSLHATGHDAEALAEIQQMPPEMRRQLEADPDYLQTVGSIYAAMGHPADAQRFLGQAQAHYAQQGTTPPSDIDIQSAWLMFNSGQDAALYKQLMMLGGRPDLTDEQRRTVQVIWASWAVRRSQQSLAAGNPKRAIAILNAAALAFPNNPGVLKALGSGYAAAGLYKEAIQIFKAQDLSTGTASDYRAAVGAALAANDLKDAEVWLRFGLDQYPKDAQLLGLAAKFETARGNPGRAADYYRASLNAMPGPDPGAELAEEMAHPPLQALPKATQPQDLATLLSQPDGVPRNGYGTPVDSRPYLPGYGTIGAQAPVVLNKTAPVGSTPGYNPGMMNRSATPSTTYVVPSTTMTNTPGSSAISGMSGTPGYNYAAPPTAVPQSYGTPMYSSPSSNMTPQSYAPQTYLPSTTRPSAPATLGSYVPQSSVVAKPLPGRKAAGGDEAVLHLKASPEMEAKYGPYRSFVPGETMPGDADSAALESAVVAASFVRGVQQGFVSVKGKKSGERREEDLPRLSYLPVSGVGAGAIVAASFVGTPQQTTTADGTPIVPYAPLAQAKRNTTAAPAQTTSPSKPYTQPGTTAKPTTHTATTHTTGTPSGSKPANPFATFGTKAAPAQTTSSASPTQSTAVHPIHLSSTPAKSSHAATHTASSAPPYVPPPVYIPGEPAPDAAIAPVRSAIPADRTIHYAPLAPPKQDTSSASKRAAAIRANQANAPLVLEGTSHPPDENYDTETNDAAKINAAQFSTSPYNPAQMQGSQVVRPTAPVGTTTTNGTTTSSGGQQDTTPTAGQQYPQPNTRTTTTPSHKRTTTRTQTTTTVPVPVPTQPAPMSYPIYPQPLQNDGTPVVPGAYPLPAAPSDIELQDRGAPPLRGYFDPRVSTNPKEPLTDREQTELDLALIEASYSAWMGGSVEARYRSGRPGIDRLTALETPFEATFMLGKTARVSVVPKAVFLNSGQLVLDPTAVVTPLVGSLYSNATTAVTQQYASGVGGELQFVTSTFAAALGYSPYGFPVSNLIGRARWRPGNWHFTFYGGRDSVTETMLSYAGLRDPGSPFGNIWGGVVAAGGGVRFDAGDEHSGLYVQGEGADVSGYHVLDNRKYDGTMGAYFRVKTWPDYGSLNIGGTVYGEHYQYNELGETYGLGGYFSPNVYFLAAVPITFSGHYKENLHYVINGSVGLQTFQANSQIFFPLDGASQAGVPATACTPVCGTQASSNTGANYSLDSQLSYHINSHWYIGGFLSANNTNNYNTISGGVFARYTFKPQVQTVEYPTGLFPVEGFRPLRVP